MWVPEPTERWIEPEEVARRQRRTRGRWRALRHAVVMLLVIAVVGGVGVIAGGAVLGRWDLPWSPTPTVVQAVPSTGPTVGAELDCDPATVVPAGIEGTSAQVLNATNRGGLAGSVSDELAARGFTMLEPGNFSTPETATARVRFPAGAEPAALSVAAHLQGAVLQLDPDVDVVTVVIGDSWAGTTTVEEAAVLAAEPQPSVVSCADAVVEPDEGASGEPSTATG